MVLVSGARVGAVVTCEVVLLGADPVGVLYGAAEVQHGQHGDNHHNALQQQGQLKLLPYPAEGGRTHTLANDDPVGTHADQSQHSIHSQWPNEDTVHTITGGGGG